MAVIAERAARIKPSPTLAISTKAKALKAKGAPVIDFSVGEPDFDTPEHIKQAAHDALDAGVTKYTPAAGTPALREAICRKLEQDNGLSYAPEQIVVSCGAKHSLFNIFMAMINSGDEVIIPAPYWVSYPDQVLLADGKPVFLPTDESCGFKITPQQLEAAITPRTRAVVINSPSNPTGGVYLKEELAALADVVLQHPDLYVVSDEIYEKLIYDGREHSSIAALRPGMQERTILVNGMSKAYSMTGWRLGYTASVVELAKQFAKIQSQSTSNPTSFAQAGGVAALTGSQEPTAKMAKEFDRRRRVVVEGLNALRGVTCRMPEGAFYAYPNMSGLVGETIAGVKIESADEFADLLLEQQNVAVVPGRGFGTPNNFRVSYATSMEAIAEGLQRMKTLIG